MLLFKLINELIYIPSQCLPVLSPATYTRSNLSLKLQHLYARTNQYNANSTHTYYTMHGLLMKQFIPELISSWFVIFCIAHVCTYSWQPCHIRDKVLSCLLLLSPSMYNAFLITKLSCLIVRVSKPAHIKTKKLVKFLNKHTLAHPLIPEMVFLWACPFWN